MSNVKNKVLTQLQRKGVVLHPLNVFSPSFKTAYTKALKLLEFFNFIIENIICKNISDTEN